MINSKLGLISHRLATLARIRSFKGNEFHVIRKGVAYDQSDVDTV